MEIEEGWFDCADALIISDLVGGDTVTLCGEDSSSYDSSWVTASSNQLHLTFTSDFSSEYRGFLVSFRGKCFCLHLQAHPELSCVCDSGIILPDVVCSLCLLHFV